MQRPRLLRRQHWSLHLQRAIPAARLRRWAVHARVPERRHMRPDTRDVLLRAAVLRRGV